MRYNHFDMLPERAFQKVGFRMTLEGGGGGGPSSTQTTGTTYQTNIPEYAQPYVTTMLNATQRQLFTGQPKTESYVAGYNTDAEGNQTPVYGTREIPGSFEITGFNPYRAYGGTYDAQGNMLSYDPSKAVAGFSPLQSQAQTAAAGLETPSQFGPATGMATTAGLGSLGIARRATGAGSEYERMATNPYDVSRYMSPYMQNVVDYQKTQALRDYNIGQQVRKAQAAGQGAFGGSRQAIMEAEAQRSLMSQLGGIEAQGAQSAFDKAQQAQQFGANLGLQGYQTGLQGLAQTGAAAGQLGQLGTQQLAAQQGVIQTQAQQGATQQALQQQIINQAIQDYANAQQYPLMQLGTMSNMLRGLPMQAASTQQYVAQANPTTQAIGTIGSLGSLYGAFGGYGGQSTGRAEGGILSAKKYAKGGIASYDIGGEVEADLYDMPMERLQKELQSPSAQIRKKAKRIMAEKSIEGKAGGGIIAFAGGTPDPEVKKEEEEKERTAEDVQYAPGIKGGRPAPARPAAPTEKPLDLSLQGVKKMGATQYQDLAKQANRPLSEIVAEEKAMMGPNVGAQKYRESVMAERANAEDEFKRQNWLRAAQIFADWGSQPGNTLVAGMNALKGRIGDVISDREAQRKYYRDIDKTMYELDKADRLEEAGYIEAARKTREKAGEQGFKMFGHLSDIARTESSNAATLAAAQTRSAGGNEKLSQLYNARSTAEARLDAAMKNLPDSVKELAGMNPEGKSEKLQADIAHAKRQVAERTGAIQKEINQIDATIKQVLTNKGMETPTGGEGGDGGAKAGPPTNAVDYLKKNDTPENRRYFDEKYGAGAAARALK